MKNKVISIVLIAGLIVILGGAFVLYNYLGKQVEVNGLQVKEETKEEIVEESVEEEKEDKSNYTKAYDFMVYDENNNSYKLSDFEGKPVVLNFWASWCGPCKSEMPDFEIAYQEYGEKIQFLMINMTDGYQETVSSANDFIKDKGYTFPVFYDSNLEAAKAYSVYSIPATYFIDAEGYIIAWGSGALSAENLQEGINYIYSE